MKLSHTKQTTPRHWNDAATVVGNGVRQPSCIMTVMMERTSCHAGTSLQKCSETRYQVDKHSHWTNHIIPLTRSCRESGKMSGLKHSPTCVHILRQKMRSHAGTWQAWVERRSCRMSVVRGHRSAGTDVSTVCPIPTERTDNEAESYITTKPRHWNEAAVVDGNGIRQPLRIMTIMR